MTTSSRACIKEQFLLLACIMYMLRFSSAVREVSTAMLWDSNALYAKSA